MIIFIAIEVFKLITYDATTYSMFVRAEIDSFVLAQKNFLAWLENSLGEASQHCHRFLQLIGCEGTCQKNACCARSVATASECLLVCKAPVSKAGQPISKDRSVDHL